VDISENNCIDDLRITFRGNHNTVKIGRGCSFYRSNSIFIQGDGNAVVIGDDVTFDQNVSIVCCEGTRVEIGSDCIFANGVRIRTSDQHGIYDRDGNRVNPAKDVRIGNHVWCGASVIVIKGVTIGDGAVVGINSMVLKDVPANAVVVGSPARVSRSNVRWEK